MYINPFIAGALATILLEMIAIIAYAFSKRKK